MSAHKIVVIDDSRTVRQQVRLVLEGAKYAVVEACDGADGIEVTCANADASLVICDVNMPERNGIEVLQALKADPATSGLPVLMLTTSSQPALIREARSAGALGWIIKPFDAAQLLDAVEMVVAQTA